MAIILHPVVGSGFGLKAGALEAGAKIKFGTAVPFPVPATAVVATDTIAGVLGTAGTSVGVWVGGGVFDGTPVFVGGNVLVAEGLGEVVGVKVADGVKVALGV